MYPRLHALRVRHDILESKIDGELARPRPDQLRLTLLKRMKLKLRDEIAGIENALAVGQRLERRAEAG
jgi:hypothetical protein